MNIGTVAARSGVSTKAIRYYESIGLIPPAPRSDNGYRHYSDRDVQKLKFVQRARGLGFSVEDVASLLGLWQNQRRSDAQVRALARRHMTRVEEKIRELESIVNVLDDLVERCQRGDRPHCPILEEIERDAAEPGVVAVPRRRGIAN